MKKRKLFVFNTVIFEIVLLISISFAISFILSENLTEAANTLTGAGADTASALAKSRRDSSKKRI